MRFSRKRIFARIFKLTAIIMLLLFIDYHTYMSAQSLLLANQRQPSELVFVDTIKHKPKANNTTADCHLPFNLKALIRSNQTTKTVHGACKKHIDWIIIDDHGQFLFNYKYLNEMAMTIEKCTYSSISWHDDFHYTINTQDIPFTNGSYLNENIDLFVVHCTASKPNTLFNMRYRSAFARIRNDRHPIVNDRDVEPINVMLLGLDSMSKALWLKHLPKTSVFLLDKLKSNILSGFNVVGDGTPPTLIGILTGKFEHELPNTIANTDNNHHVDKVYPFIWQTYADELGYATLFAEDWPSIGVFNYRMVGMSKPPTTHYMRPFQLAIAGESMLKASSKLCLHGRKQLNVMLDYTFDFMRKYEKRGFIGMTFLSDYTHDPDNEKEWADGILAEYLQKFIQSGLNGNTILILFSDHGPRFSSVRATVRGLLEERNPFMSIFLPDLFKVRYPTQYATLVQNKDNLITPFDVHATLMDLLNMETKSRQGSNESIKTDRRQSDDHRAISLFKQISSYRTCDEAGIDAHWCSCLKRSELEIDSYANEIAQGLVDFINHNLLDPVKDLCTQLSLNKVSRIFLLEAQKSLTEKRVEEPMNRKGFFRRIIDFFFSPNLLGPVKVTTHYEQYQLMFETLPSRAVFEATVVIERSMTNSKKVNLKIDENLISRINKYGNQSICVHDTHPDLRKYCSCK